jgi:deoxyribodipyrimidine photo-lyase
VTRIRTANAQPVRGDRDYVLYWMIAARRVAWSFAMDRAIALARDLGKPLIVLEPLRVDYPWASDRLHRFVIDGMHDNQRAFAGTPIAYHPYVEPCVGAGKGLLVALAERACVVVTDAYPCFFLPRMVEAASRRLDVALEVCDGNGIVPIAAVGRAYPSAAHFRRAVQKLLPDALARFPSRQPLRSANALPAAGVPRSIATRWPAAALPMTSLQALPIDHDVPPAPIRGGAKAGRATLRRFVAKHLDDYPTLRNDPSADATSRLSPYLHFGHLGVHEVFAAVAEHDDWDTSRLAQRATGAREGWWGASPAVEAFLDQLIVWRELAFNTATFVPAYEHWASLPAWARATLDEHRGDPRPHRYTRAQLERAATHDPLWNAAQRQLLREGWFHGYLRMLWGKKILEWSSSPKQALATMIAIMNRWSLDGRDPNAYAGYAWTLGRYDRPWPERAIYGKVRTMSSERTAKKVDVEAYAERYGEET